MGVSLQEALINGLAGVAVDSNSNVYIAEIFNNVVRKIDIRTNIVTTIAGCGDKGFSGDGGPAVKARLNGPEGVFVDSYGNVYIADTWNQRIRKIDSKTGIIKTIAGNGEAGFSGDFENACDASLNSPSGVLIVLNERNTLELLVILHSAYGQIQSLCKPKVSVPMCFYLFLYTVYASPCPG